MHASSQSSPISVALRALVCLLTLPSFCAGAYLGGARRMCANQEVASFPSPDGRLRAVVFERDCAWLSDYTTRESILGRDERLDEGDTGTAWAGAHGLKRRLLQPACGGMALALELSWADDRTLRVGYDRRVERRFEASEARGVEVRCAARAPRPGEL